MEKLIRKISLQALPQFLGNKTECALLVYAQGLAPGYDYHAVRKEGEQNEQMLFNFTSDRKRMSTIVKIPDSEYPYRMYTKVLFVVHRAISFFLLILFFGK